MDIWFDLIVAIVKLVAVIVSYIMCYMCLRISRKTKDEHEQIITMLHAILFMVFVISLKT